MSSSLHMFLAMLFIHVGKRSNSRSQMFFKTHRCSKKFRNVHRKTPVLETLFIKVTGLTACILIKKETPTQVFSCEYCKIFKNSFFVEHLLIILFRNFVMIDIRYFRIIFYYFKIRPRNRKNFTIDQPKCLVNRWFFSILLQRFFCYLIISLLQRVKTAKRN